MISTETAAKETDKIFTAGYILLCLTFLFFLSAAFMLLAVLPLYVQEVGGRASEVGIIIGSLGLTIVPVELWVGRLADIKGRKVILIIGTFILMIALLAFNFVATLPLLILAQLFRGIGMGCFFPTSMALAADLAPPRRRGEAFAYISAIASVALGISPPIGIFLANSFGFTAVFSVAPGLALVAFLLALNLPDKKPSRESASSTGLGWINRRALFPSLVWSTFTFSLGAVFAFVPVLVAQRQLGNPGLFFTINAISVVVTRALTAKLSDRYGRSAAIIPGMLLTPIALTILPFSNSMAMVLIASAIYGTAYALILPALAALAIDRVRAEDRGAAMGTFSAGYDIGFTTGAMLSGGLLQLAGFATVFVSAAAVSLIGLASYLGWVAKPGQKDVI